MELLYEKQFTCCFTGHRFVPVDVSQKMEVALKHSIEQLIAKGVKTFISGGALGFDIMAAKNVLKAKEKHPDIMLVMAIPCRDQHMRWSTKDKSEYEEILKVADDIICLNDKYCIGCMHQRNRFMVGQSSYCIAYYTGKSGGTAYTISLAGEYGLEVLNIAKML